MTRLKLRTLDDLRPLVKEGKYRVGTHALRHGLCEGFTEQDMIGALLYGKELVRYKEDQRLLVLGFICPRAGIKIPLHVVAEYAATRRVDIVTAFIPKDTYKVVSRARLAEMLRHDRHIVQTRVVG